MSKQESTTRAKPTDEARVPAWLKKQRVWVFALIAIIYLAGFNGQFHMGSDAALYAEVGRNIAEGNGYTYHGRHETLLYPGLPFLHALSRTISSEHHSTLSHAFLLAMGLATIMLAYQIYLFYLPHSMALLALVMTAFSFSVYEYSFNLMTDMPYTLGVTAAMLGYIRLLVASPSDAASSIGTQQKRCVSNRFDRLWPWLALILGMSLAMVMRPTMLALVLALLAGGLSHLLLGKYRMQAVLAIGLTVVLLASFYSLDVRQTDHAGLHYEAGLIGRVTSPADTLHRMAFDTSPLLIRYVFAEALFAVDMSMPANLIPTAFALVFLCVGCWRRWIWGVFVVINLGGMLVMSAEAPRYLLPMLPIFMIGAAQTYHFIALRFPKPFGMVLSFSFLIMLLGMNVAKISKLAWTQHSQPFYEVYKDGKFAPRLEAAKAIERYVTTDDTVIAANFRELTYASGKTVIDLNVLSEKRTAPVFRKRLTNNMGCFYIIEQHSTPIPETFLGYRLQVGDVIAESAPGTSTEASWQLREVSLSVDENNQLGGADED